MGQGEKQSVQEGFGPRQNPGDEEPPGTPQTGEHFCRKCKGSGTFDGAPCQDCGGTGRVIVDIGDA
jgi:DnaJ-class molecular chaperone